MTREKAISILKHTIVLSGRTNGKTAYAEALQMAIKALEEPQWTPTSGKPPENGRQVLIYASSVHYALAKYDEMLDADGTFKKQWVTFDAWKPFYTIKDVLAWRELPEPYKKET